MMISNRAADVTPFIAMDVLEQANAMDDVLHLEVGEPDFDPPDAVFDELITSVEGGNTGYTSARGKRKLRAAIAELYFREYGVDIDSDRILITPGSSPALYITLATLVDPGKRVILTDPHYACYPNFVRSVGGTVQTIPLDAETGFRPTIEDVNQALSSSPCAILLNSPANPTGAVIEGETLARIAREASRQNVRIVMDEIYHGLTYDGTEHSILEYTDEAFVLNGFSKRYGMTGWRLGWIVVPPDFISPVNRLIQNLLICAPNFVQDAGIAALNTPSSQLDSIRDTYRDRRDVLLTAVKDWDLDLGYTPQGAYYLLVDTSSIPGDSVEIAERILNESGVAVTPGKDFGSRAETYLRFSYATDIETIERAIRRIERWLESNKYV